MTRANFVSVAALSLALGACVAGPAPEIATPPPALPQSFSYAPGDAEERELEALLPNDDPAFIALVERALNDSPDLLAQASRLRRALAELDGSRARRLPQVGGDASITATRTSPNQFGGSIPGGNGAGPGFAIDTERVAYGANISASWDPDLFGRLSARQRAADSRLMAADAEVAAVRLSLIAEIAGAVIDWRTLQSRQQALREDVVAAETLVALADIRERAGIAPGFDRVRAETTAEASRSRLAALANDEPRIVGRLVALTTASGQRVRAVLSDDTPLDVAEAAPAALPSQLLANRPDILAASARLAATDADLAATAANRFPQFTLSAALGLLAFDLGDLFDEDAVVGSVGGSLLAPILDFGRIEADIDAAAADKRIAFQSYRGQVFSALGEAETAYGLVETADRELAASRRERASATRAAELAEVRFRAGLSNFLTVLDSRRVADASGERAAAAQGRAARARVLLWQALGGDVLEQSD